MADTERVYNDLAEWMEDLVAALVAREESEGAAHIGAVRCDGDHHDLTHGHGCPHCGAVL